MLIYVNYGIQELKKGMTGTDVSFIRRVDAALTSVQNDLRPSFEFRVPSNSMLGAHPDP